MISVNTTQGNHAICMDKLKYVGVMIFSDSSSRALSMEMELRDLGIEEIQFTNDEFVVQKLASRAKGEANLIISDFSVSKMHGVQLLHDVREINNDIPFLLVTGKQSFDLEKVAEFGDNTSFILTPYGADELRECVLELLYPALQYKIIIAEDNIANARLLEKALLNLGLKDIYVTKNGQEAIQVLEKKEGDIDLIISDLVMPGMDGLEFLENVRTSYPSMPFIMITGQKKIDPVIEAKDMGVTLYIQKPISLKKLNKSVKELIDL